MKDIDILSKIIDYVFSFGMFMFLVIVGFIFLIVGAVEQSNEERDQTQKITEACYAQGMVLVFTDAGQRCADPKSLVKVK